ncbi:MAG: hypothetical protein ACOC8D_01800 [bacterium]
MTLADHVARELHPVRARQALEPARKPRPDAWLWFPTPDADFDLAANAIALLLCLAKARWKPLHWRRATFLCRGRPVCLPRVRYRVQGRHTGLPLQQTSLAGKLNA